MGAETWRREAIIKPYTIVEKVNLADLHELEDNPRYITKKEFDSLKQSVKDFPEMLEVREIVIDENNVILGGNQRYKALLANGCGTAQVKRLVNWTDEMKRRFVIKDNKQSGDWDMDTIANSWTDDPDAAKIIEDSFRPREYFGDERERTYKATNLNYFDQNDCAGVYQFPNIYPCDILPSKLIGFNEVKTAKDKNSGVHFFIDDYQFERIWTSPEKYAKMLSEFEVVFTPDFSLYTDMPLAMKIWNTYRSRMIGQIMQDKGINVIPTITWAGEETFDFIYDGLPMNSTIAISTVGVVKNSDAKKLWEEGIKKTIETLAPKQVILYGKQLEFDAGDAKVYNFLPRRHNV